MIGLFSDSYYPVVDGVTLVVQNYAYWLCEKGYPACIITPNVPNYIDKQPFPVYRYASLPLLIRRPYRIGIPHADFPFRKKMKALSFKILHIHSPFSSGWLALNLAKQKKTPVIATFHSKLKDDFRRVVNNERIADMMIKKVIRLYEAADEVWIPQAAVETTIREYGYKGKIVVMDNGCDFSIRNEEISTLKQQAKTALNIHRNIPVLLFVGQHIWEKNTKLVIDALAAIKEEPFIMFFIGTGYAAKELKNLTKEYGLEEKVKFMGVLLDREQLKHYYTAADLLIFPSLYDNAPLVLREAAALHTPAILVKGATASGIITDNYNGFLVQNSVEALSERLRTLLHAPGLIREVGQNAAQTIVRSWENIADAVIDRYTQLIERHAADH